MQKTLTLTAADPIETQEIDAALHAIDFISLLSDLMETLRRRADGEGQDAEAAEKFKNELWREIQDYNLERFF